MPSTVEYCISNVDDVQAVREQCSESSARVMERRCLQRCGRCFREPFLVVDGDVVTGADHEALLAEVTEQ
ncbi:DUF1450 domain-containing protein [Halobium palmae]|uniref:DUF1450 domain-containing protein n=1 Tax=Halobium palmae TaxID=1776492 RepID=A0ABD5RWH9_9EURY